MKTNGFATCSIKNEQMANFVYIDRKLLDVVFGVEFKH